MAPGTSLLLALYYRDAGGNQVVVASTTVVHSRTTFPNLNHLIDFQVEVPVVQATDAWAGQHVGIQLLSTVDFASKGGYWDVDHVRLEANGEAVLSAPGFLEGKFGFTLNSLPGLEFEILASADVSLPLSSWTSLATVTNVTGTLEFRDPSPTLDRRYYRARQLD